MADQSRFVVGTVKPENAAVFDRPPRTATIYFGKREELKLGCGICEIPPGSSNQRHAHDDADEVIYVIQGTVRFEFPGESVTLVPPQAIYIPQGLDHPLLHLHPDRAGRGHPA